MSKVDCDALIASYLEWLRKGITTAELGDTCEITTPFLDRHNDRLQIYVKQTDHGLRLTDDGYIISDLEMSGCSLDTPARQKMLQTILGGFGVSESNGELSVVASPPDFPRKKHLLLQAMLAVNDMFMTAKSTVTNLFLEDVQAFFDANNIRYSPRVEFTGQSGFIHKFDFLIPKSKDAPERLVKAVNHPTRESVTPVLFAVTDTKKTRPADAESYVILNDQSETPLKEDLITAFSEYQIRPVRWTEREQYLRKFAA